MKVFITGINGQLGYDVAKECLAREYEVIGCGRTKECDLKNIEYYQLDLCNSYNVTNLLYKCKPDIIIHCAAYTEVDKAETQETIVYQINANATKFLAKAAEMINAKIVYISTDYVFDGTGIKPWEPEDERNPINVYGASKSLGESYIQYEASKYFIVRTQWLYGAHGKKNFVKTMIALGKRDSCLNVIDDQWGIPTYTPDLAKYICDLMITDNYDIYHVTNGGKYTTWYRFNTEILRYVNINPVVHPIETEIYQKKTGCANRPLNGRLDTSKNLYQLPDWKDALRRYLWETGQL